MSFGAASRCRFRVRNPGRKSDRTSPNPTARVHLWPLGFGSGFWSPNQHQSKVTDSRSCGVQNLPLSEATPPFCIIFAGSSNSGAREWWKLQTGHHFCKNDALESPFAKLGGSHGLAPSLASLAEGAVPRSGVCFRTRVAACKIASLVVLVGIEGLAVTLACLSASSSRGKPETVAFALFLVLRGVAIFACLFALLPWVSLFAVGGFGRAGDLHSS